MAELEGNVLRPPGFGPTVTLAPVEELLAKTGYGTLQVGGTIAAGAGIVRVGEPLRRQTTGNTKLWEKCTYAQAQGLSRNAVDATSEAKLLDIVLGGVVNVNVQAILPANAAALATALGGTYYPTSEWIKF